MYSPVGGSTEWRVKSCGSSCPYSSMSTVSYTHLTVCAWQHTCAVLRIECHTQCPVSGRFDGLTALKMRITIQSQECQETRHMSHHSSRGKFWGLHEPNFHLSHLRTTLTRVRARCAPRQHSFFEKVVRARSTYRSTDSYYRRI